MQNRIIGVILALGLVLMSGGCGRRQSDTGERLLRVEERMSADPKASLLALDSIDREGLAEPDRMLYDLLRVKASDKAREKHTDEKKILDVVDYYARTGDRERHAESLYYAGCVFSDLGDLPTALQYYQQALDITPEKPEDFKQGDFKARVLYHMAFLLRTMRLYSQAFEYLDEGSAILEQTGDSVRLMYNLEMYASIYIRKKEYAKAVPILQRSIRIAEKGKDSDLAMQQMYLAGVYKELNKPAQALNLIRSVPERVRKGNYATALGYASDIYLANGIKDTAYMYAHRLCQLDSTNNQKHGFQNILATDLIEFLPKDSMLWYVKKYSDVMEGFVSSNADEAALMQDSSFNYDIHDRKRAKAEHIVMLLSWSVVGALLLIFILIIVILQQRVRNRNRELRIQKAVNEILAGRVKSESDKEGEVPVDDIVDAQDVCPSFRNRLREDLTRHGGEVAPSQALLDSEVHEALEKRLASNKTIPDKSPVWAEIEKTILAEAPDFKNSLTILSDGKLKPVQYNLAMLIKLGISPSQCASLLSKSKQAITYQRKQLVIKILGSDSEYNKLDSIIHLL